MSTAYFPNYKTLIPFKEFKEIFNNIDYRDSKKYIDKLKKDNVDEDILTLLDMRRLQLALTSKEYLYLLDNINIKDLTNIKINYKNYKENSKIFSKLLNRLMSHVTLYSIFLTVIDGTLKVQPPTFLPGPPHTYSEDNILKFIASILNKDVDNIPLINNTYNLLNMSEVDYDVLFTEIHFKFDDEQIMPQLFSWCIPKLLDFIINNYIDNRYLFILLNKRKFLV